MDSPVEQVRAGVDIVELVSQHVSLKKAGRTYKALCPFHTEKTPSFVVFPDTGHWHCFGCGEGGDVFSFLMKIENLTFPEALRRLADRIGVAVTWSREPDERREAKKRLHAANEAAAIFYHGLLLNTRSARQYAASRGITDDTVREFLLGLAPDSSDALQRHLLQQGFVMEEMLRAGLLYEPEDGPPRDRYRGRWMFPIRDADGQIVSFGARTLTGEAQPKYLNGPQTDIFDKGGTLFGLHGAAQAIRKELRAVVVEGYVDVVVAHQAGFRNVVATLGTSITERHLRQLARLAPEICMALDPDSAGEAAALRSAEVARVSLADTAVPVPTWRGLIRYQAGSRASITVAALPEGKDPDELILEDPERWRAAIGSARPVVDYAIDWVVHRYDVASARGKAEAADGLVPLLMDVADPIVRSHYVELAAQALRVDSAALAQRLRAGGARGQRPGVRSTHGPLVSSNPRPPSAPYGEQDYAIALAVAAAHRGLSRIDLDSGDFTDPAARALVLRIEELMRSDLRGDWRPDLLAAAREPWLEAPISRVRRALAGVERLTDAQITASAGPIARQLRDSRLAIELPEMTALARESDPESLAQLKARIAEINRERAALRRQDADGPRGPAAVGGRAALVPPRFRPAVQREPVRPTGAGEGAPAADDSPSGSGGGP